MELQEVLRMVGGGWRALQELLCRKHSNWYPPNTHFMFLRPKIWEQDKSHTSLCPAFLFWWVSKQVRNPSSCCFSLRTIWVGMRHQKTPTVKESAKQVTDVAVDSGKCYQLFFFFFERRSCWSRWVDSGVTIYQSHSIKQRNPKESLSKKIIS